MGRRQEIEDIIKQAAGQKTAPLDALLAGHGQKVKDSVGKLPFEEVSRLAQEGMVYEEQKAETVGLQDKALNFFAGFLEAASKLGLDMEKLLGVQETATVARSLLIDSESHRVYLGDDTGVKVTERGFNLLKALQPGQAVSIETVRTRGWKDPKASSRAVAGGFDQANRDLSPLLNGEPAVERPELGIYVLNPKIKIAGDLIPGQDQQVASEPQSLEPRTREKLKTPIDQFTLSATKVHEETGIHIQTIASWVKNVLVKDFHFHKPRNHTRVVFAPVAVEDIKVVTQKAKETGKRVQDTTAKNVIQDLMKARRREDDEPKHETFYYVSSVAEAVGLTPPRVNQLVEMGLIATQKSPGDKHIFTELKPENAIKLAEYLNAHPEVKNVKKPLLQKIFGLSESHAQVQAGEEQDTSPRVEVSVEALRNATHIIPRDFMQLEQSGVLMEGIHYKIGTDGHTRIYFEEAIAAVTKWRAEDQKKNLAKLGEFLAVRSILNHRDVYEEKLGINFSDGTLKKLKDSYVRLNEETKNIWLTDPDASDKQKQEALRNLRQLSATSIWSFDSLNPLLDEIGPGRTPELLQLSSTLIMKPPRTSWDTGTVLNGDGFDAKLRKRID